MKLGGCRTIVCDVRDPVETARWFEQHLSARLLYADDEWVSLRLFEDGPRIGLHRSDDGVGRITAFYEVEDIDGALRALGEAGCAVEHARTELDDVVIATVRTPAGLVLGLEQPKHG